MKRLSILGIVRTMAAQNPGLKSKTPKNYNHDKKDCQRPSEAGQNSYHDHAEERDYD